MRDGTVIAASASTSSVLGAEPTELIGRPLPDPLPQLMLTAEVQRLDLQSEVPSNVRIDLESGPYDLIWHTTAEGLTIVELEVSPDVATLPQLDAALRSLQSPRSLDELQHHTVSLLRRMLGTERAVFYTFHSDGHGEVVAEDAEDELPRYLGLHFPASDIPPQARALYIAKGVQYVRSRDAEPVAIIGHEDARPDLTRAELRAISPHHLTYMRNMGVASSVSFALVERGQLIGMITCSSSTSSSISYPQRVAGRIVAEAAISRLSVERRALATEQRTQRKAVRAELISQVEGAHGALDSLVSGEHTLLDLVAADGAIVRDDDTFFPIGRTPGPERLHDVFTALGERRSPLASEALELEHPALASLMPGVSGLLVAGDPHAGGQVIWLRHDVTESVEWLGDPGRSNRADALSPRTSFDRWNTEMEGLAEPWSEIDLIAAEQLAHELVELTARRLLEAEMTTAREVQGALQPREGVVAHGLAVASRFLPARTIAGDFLDWGLRRDPGGSPRFTLVLGDVMGKGIGAGMLAAAARTAFRSVPAAASVVDAVSLVEGVLADELLRAASFITAVAIELDPSTGALHYCDAGHGLAFVARRTGGLEALVAHGVPIGVLGEGDRLEGVATLDPGDALVVLSDGAAELWPTLAAMVDALSSTWSDDEGAEPLLRLIEERAAAEPTLADDVTAVVVHRAEAPDRG